MVETHSSHYAEKRIEPIDVQEQIMEVLVNIPPVQRHLIAHSVKYLMRAGSKAGEPWEKDIQKAFNYLHRALTGEWVKK